MDNYNFIPPFFLFLVTAASLNGGRGCRTQFWKGPTQGPFHQSLVQIGPVASEELIKMWKANGRTDDGRSVVTIAHMTLWIRWAKNKKHMGLLDKNGSLNIYYTSRFFDRQYTYKMDSDRHYTYVQSLKMHKNGFWGTLYTCTKNYANRDCNVILSQEIGHLYTLAH